MSLGRRGRGPHGSATWRSAGAVRLAAALALTLAGCGAEPGPPRYPTEAAIAVFDLARARPEPARERLEQVFGPLDDAAAEARLRDALAGLPAGRVRYERMETLVGDGAAAVDLRVDLRGGGVARFTCLVVPNADATWSVRWLQGPGVGWPTARVGGGPGLSTRPAD